MEETKTVQDGEEEKEDPVPTEPAETPLEETKTVQDGEEEKGDPVPTEPAETPVEETKTVQDGEGHVKEKVPAQAAETSVEETDAALQDDGKNTPAPATKHLTLAHEFFDEVKAGNKVWEFRSNEKWATRFSSATHLMFMRGILVIWIVFEISVL